MRLLPIFFGLLLSARAAFAADALTPDSPLPTLTFNGTKYTLANVDAKDTFILNEYTPAGQTLGNWTQLISVGAWPKGQKPIETVSALLKAAKPYLVANPQVVGSNGTESTDLGVVLVQNDTQHASYTLEVQRHAIEPGSPGVKWYRYSMRFKPGTTLPNPEQVNTWLAALRQLNTTLYLLPMAAPAAAGTPSAAPVKVDPATTPPPASNITSAPAAAASK
jgi:hypothetical protein